jgi:hypothetical protein
MVLVTASKQRRLLYLSLIGRVELHELKNASAEVASLLKDLEAGFRLLTDFERLESVNVEGAAEIGKVMELCDQKGVSLVVRVIPDRSKDIGMNILTLFHYRHRPRMVTCASMLEACQALSL